MPFSRLGKHKTRLLAGEMMVVLLPFLTIWPSHWFYFWCLLSLLLSCAYHFVFVPYLLLFLLSIVMF